MRFDNFDGLFSFFLLLLFVALAICRSFCLKFSVQARPPTEIGLLARSGMGARVTRRVHRRLLRSGDVNLRGQRATLPHWAQRAKTTVLMAAFNEERFIARAIESVFRQTEQAFRLLIVDDGSSDHTFEISSSYLKDSRVRLLRERHRGPWAALQKGLHSVETPYLLRLDGDDELLPSAIEGLQEVIEQLSPPVALVYANHILVDEQTGTREIRRGHFLRSRYDVLCFAGPMAPRLYRVSALRALGGWSRDDPYGGRFMEDRLLEFKLAGRF